MTGGWIGLVEFWLSVVLIGGGSLWAAGHALLTRATSTSALGWIGVTLLFPPIGAVLYYMFGINRVHVRARRLDRRSRHGLGSHRPGEGAEIRSYAGHLSRARQGLGVAGDRLSAWPVVVGNDVELLANGEQAYPPMLAAIEAAERFVYLTTYIFETDGVGEQFIDALADAAERGVDVRVLIDGIGEYYAWPGPKPVARLRDFGVTAVRFLPPRLWPPSLQLNLRNHRKMLIVDDGPAFTGGMNIGDRHLANQPGGYYDVHFRLAGPVIRQLEGVFLSDWAFVTGRFDTASHDPASGGGAACRAFENGPTRDPGRLSALIQSAIASAEARVWLASPYFLPDEALTGALETAALRGVDVTIVLPSSNNLVYVGWASRHGLGYLLARGVRIVYRPPPFAHTKLLVIDNDYALVGSPNIDPRSLRLNFEFAVEIFGARSVAPIAEHLANAIDAGQPYTLADSRKRALPVRLRDGLFWLLSPYL